MHGGSWCVVPPTAGVTRGARAPPRRVGVAIEPDRTELVAPQQAALDQDLLERAHVGRQVRELTADVAVKLVALVLGGTYRRRLLSEIAQGFHHDHAPVQATMSNANHEAFFSHVSFSASAWTRDVHTVHTLPALKPPRARR